MGIEDLRYIVFVLDSKIEQHDGKVFCSILLAKEFIQDCINDKYGDKFILGSFVNKNEPDMAIAFIETFGLKNSVKNIKQLSLFK